MKTSPKTPTYVLPHSASTFKYWLGRKTPTAYTTTKLPSLKKNSFKFKAPAKFLEIGTVQSYLTQKVKLA
jgi:hypothetical protein